VPPEAAIRRPFFSDVEWTIRILAAERFARKKSALQIKKVRKTR
jgi:hypothetical protein